MDVLLQELPQLIMSVVFLAGLFVLLALKIVSPTDPVFIVGSGSGLTIVLGYWFYTGAARLHHTQTMAVLAKTQPVGEVLPAPQEPKPLILPPEHKGSVQPEPATTTTEPIHLQPQSESAHQEGNA